LLLLVLPPVFLSTPEILGGCALTLVVTPEELFPSRELVGFFLAPATPAVCSTAGAALGFEAVFAFGFGFGLAGLSAHATAQHTHKVAR